LPPNMETTTLSAGVALTSRTRSRPRLPALLPKPKPLDAIAGHWCFVIAEETADAAFAKWERYKAGADLEALARRASQAGADTSAGADSNINRFKAEGATLPANMVSFIGAYADVAAMLDTMAQIDGVHGVMLVFDDYIEGIEKFGKFIQPLMKSRAGIAKAVA
jgi:pyrimidine oxygenase